MRTAQLKIGLRKFMSYWDSEGTISVEERELAGS